MSDEPRETAGAAPVVTRAEEKWIDALPRRIAYYEIGAASFAVIWGVIVMVSSAQRWAWSLADFAALGTAMSTPALVVTACALFISARALIVQRADMKAQLAESQRTAAAQETVAAVQQDLLNAQRTTAEAMQQAAQAQARAAELTERAKATEEVDSARQAMESVHRELLARLSDAEQHVMYWTNKIGTTGDGQMFNSIEQQNNWNQYKSAIRGHLLVASSILTTYATPLAECRANLLEGEADQQRYRRVQICGEARKQVSDLWLAVTVDEENLTRGLRRVR